MNPYNSIDALALPQLSGLLNYVHIFIHWYTDDKRSKAFDLPADLVSNMHSSLDRLYTVML